MIFQTFLKNYIEIVEKFGRMKSDVFDSRFVFGNYLMSGGQNLNIGNFLPLDLDFYVISKFTQRKNAIS
tara:strand:- start:3384 stop:3590 length:207 start_codon:yes stop_codon:yes gene_type:complete